MVAVVGDDRWNSGREGRGAIRCRCGLLSFRRGLEGLFALDLNLVGVRDGHGDGCERLFFVVRGGLGGRLLSSLAVVFFLHEDLGFCGGGQNVGPQLSDGVLDSELKEHRVDAEELAKHTLDVVDLLAVHLLRGETKQGPQFLKSNTELFDVVGLRDFSDLVHPATELAFGVLGLTLLELLLVYCCIEKKEEGLEFTFLEPSNRQLRLAVGALFFPIQKAKAAWCRRSCRRMETLSPNGLPSYSKFMLTWAFILIGLPDSIIAISWSRVIMFTTLSLTERTENSGEERGAEMIALIGAGSLERLGVRTGGGVVGCCAG